MLRKQKSQHGSDGMKNTGMRFLIILSALVVTVGFSIEVLAQASPTNKNQGPKKQTVINFDDYLIEGNIKKPELLYLLQKKQFNFKKLIKLRENFLPEMGRTAEDIQRRGDGV